MTDAWIKVKIMPESPDTDLEEIETKAEKIIAMNESSNIKMEREPVAFGINAIIATFARDENLGTDDLLGKLKEIENTISAEVIDFRRAIG